MASIQFIIIGAQKSASTFLQQCMAAHPDVWSPRGETLHFESPHYERQSPDALARLVAGRSESIVGIKRPSYLPDPAVPERIARDLPDVRLIAVLREPVKRAVSAWYHNIKEGNLPPMDAESGLTRLLDGDGLADANPRAAEILPWGRYAEQLARYQSFLDRGQLLILLQETLVRDPLPTLVRAFRHIGADDQFEPLDAITKRPQAVVYNLARLRVHRIRANALYDFDATHTEVIRRTRNPLRLGVGGAIAKFDQYVLSRLLGNKKPVLSDALQERLRAYYADDTARLERTFGLDLTPWRT